MSDFTLKRVDLLYDENKQASEKVHKEEMEIDDEINKLEEEGETIDQFQEVFEDEALESMSSCVSREFE